MLKPESESEEPSHFHGILSSVCCICTNSFIPPTKQYMRHYIHDKSELKQIEDLFFSVFELPEEEKPNVTLLNIPDDSYPCCQKCGRYARQLLVQQIELELLQAKINKTRDTIASIIELAHDTKQSEIDTAKNPSAKLGLLIYKKWCSKKEVATQPVALPKQEATERKSVKLDSPKPQPNTNGDEEGRDNFPNSDYKKPQPQRMSRDLKSITKRHEADKFLLSLDSTEDSEEVTCQLCSKVCRSKEYLEIHLRTHEQSKRLTCTVCQKTFFTVTLLKRHLQTQHGQVEEPIETESTHTVITTATPVEQPVVEEPRKDMAELKEINTAPPPPEATVVNVNPEPVTTRRKSALDQHHRQALSGKTAERVEPLPPKLVDQTKVSNIEPDLEDDEADWEAPADIEAEYEGPVEIETEWEDPENEDDELSAYPDHAEDYDGMTEAEDGDFTDFEDSMDFEVDPMIDPSVFQSEAVKFKYTLKSKITGRHCRMCRKNYATPSTLRKHVHVVHLKQKRLTCPICGISCGDHYTLTKHVMRHDPALTRVVFNCTECGLGTMTRRGLDRHYAKSHPDVDLPEPPMVRAVTNNDPMDIEIEIPASASASGLASTRLKLKPNAVSTSSSYVSTVARAGDAGERYTGAPATEIITEAEPAASLITLEEATAAVAPVTKQYPKKKKKPKSVFLYKRKRKHWRRRGIAKTLIKVEQEPDSESEVGPMAVTLRPVDVENIETDMELIREAQEKNLVLRSFNFNSTLVIDRIENDAKTTGENITALAGLEQQKKFIGPSSAKFRNNSTAASSPVVPPVHLTRVAGAGDWKSKDVWLKQQKSNTLSALTKSTLEDLDKPTPVSLPPNWKSFGAISNTLIRSPAPGSSKIVSSTVTSAQKPSAMLHSMLPTSTAPRHVAVPKNASSQLATSTPVSISTVTVPIRPKTPVKILPASVKPGVPAANKSGYWADPSNILLGTPSSTPGPSSGLFKGMANRSQARNSGQGSPTKIKKLADIAKSLRQELPKAYPAAVSKTTLQSNTTKLVRTLKKSGIGSVNVVPFGKGSGVLESAGEQEMDRIETPCTSASQGSLDVRVTPALSRPQLQYNYRHTSNEEEEEFIDPTEYLQPEFEAESGAEERHEVGRHLLKSGDTAFRNDIQALLRNPKINVSMVPDTSKGNPTIVKNNVNVTQQIVKSTLPSGIKLVPVEDVLKGKTTERDKDPLSSPPAKKRLILPNPNPSGPSPQRGTLSDFMTVVTSNTSNTKTGTGSAPKTKMSGPLPLSQLYESDHEEEVVDFPPIRIRSIQSLREPEIQSHLRNFSGELVEDAEQYQPKFTAGHSRPSPSINISNVRSMPNSMATTHRIVGATPVMLPPIRPKPRPAGQGQAQTQNRIRVAVQGQSPRNPIPGQFQQQVRPRTPQPRFINRRYRADEQKGVMRYSDYLRTRQAASSEHQAMMGSNDNNFNLPIRTSPALQQAQQRPSTGLHVQSQGTITTSNNNMVFLVLPTGTPLNNTSNLSTPVITSSIGNVTSPLLVPVNNPQNPVDADPFLNYQ